jgi:uncharacterized damage-inducible protein DinB
MHEYRSILEEALEAWDDVRAGIIEEARSIPAKDWGFRPSEDSRSVEELVIHILEVAMLMVGELTRPDTDFHRKAWPKLLRMYAREAHLANGKRELLKLLRRQLREGTKAFLEAGELHALQLIERFDGRPGTRLAWLHHGIAQEMYHRGQLALYHRLLGTEPALTRRIRGGE